MFTSTIILSGTVVIEGITFRWWLTDGIAQRLTVSHPAHGTETQTLSAEPASQARALSRAMLAAAGMVDPVGIAADVEAAPIGGHAKTGEN
jgi:hypothetical protein